MIVTISPSKAQGHISAPPSKSMSHRLLICAGLSDGTSLISNVDPSEDILATMDCLRALGAELCFQHGQVTVKGINMRKIQKPALLSCRECASTLRFMIPVCLMSGQLMKLTGSPALFRRPLSVYEKICDDRNLLFRREESSLLVQGVLSPGEYVVPGNISSQFVSGLLFALPLLQEDSLIRLTGPVESRSYIWMTIQALQSFGVTVLWEEDRKIAIPGNQTYSPRNICVEGDYSNAAFFDALNLTGGKVTVEGLMEDSLQGDRVYKSLLRQIDEGCPNIDLSDCPDLGPVLMAAAALRHGAVFTGTKRLKIKESDRGLAMQQELARMGVRTEIAENRICVFPGAGHPGEILDGHNDHRIVMALAVMLASVGGKIRGAEAVKKSLPDFFDRLASLGIDVSCDSPDC